MDKDKKEFGKWWVWILLLVVISLIVIGVTRYAGLWGQTVAERVIFENSFQYKEARKTEIATFEAQLAEITHKLTGNIDDHTRNNLEAQAAALRIQLNVARSK